MPLTPKANYAREIAGLARHSLHLTPSELRSLAEEYIALFDDYEDRYRRAKVEALNELIQKLNDYLDGIRADNGGLVADCEYRLEDAIELARATAFEISQRGR